MPSTTIQAEIQDQSQEIKSKPSVCTVLKKIYDYADASLEVPIFEDIASRLNAYLIVDALLIALLVTLLPISKAQLITAFTRTEEEHLLWNTSAFGLTGPLPSSEETLERAVSVWVASMCCMVLSFCFALFTYVNLLGAKKGKLSIWYSFFTSSVTISLYSLLIGLILFFFLCGYFVQIMGGVKAYMMFLTGFIVVVALVATFAISAAFLTAFINAGYFVKEN